MLVLRVSEKMSGTSGIEPMSQDARSQNVAPPATPMFVGWSTKDSVLNGVPSILAAIEVAVAVSAYWAVAIYLETSTHLWVSVCVAPLLLLRSDQSIALGVTWMENYVGAFSAPPAQSVSQSIQFWLGWFAGLIAAAFTAFILTSHWVLSHAIPALFLREIIVGAFSLQIGMAAAVATVGGQTRLEERKRRRTMVVLTILSVAIAIAAGAAARDVATGGAAIVARTIGAATGAMALVIAITKASQHNFEIPMMPGILAGCWLRTLAIRFTATALHLRPGFQSLPGNFVQNLFVVDFRHRAELLPGYDREELFTSDGVIRKVNEDRKLQDFVIGAMYFCILFIPAYCYRLSIKSTCWLYLPLVYIASERDFALSPEHLLARLQKTPKEWLRRLLALATLSGFIFTTFLGSLTAKPLDLLGAKLVSPVEFLFLIDINTVKPWQFFNLVGAIITVYLYFAAGDVRVDYVYSRDQHSHASLTQKVQWLKMLMRTRNVSSAILILILGVHALLLLSPVIRYLPAPILSALRSFYGDYMPAVS
jgi:hypothetical protein